jgi:hypothetical protein
MKKINFTMESDKTVLSMAQHFSTIEDGDDFGVKERYYITKANGKRQKLLARGEYYNDYQVLVWEKRLSNEMIDETLKHVSNNMEKIEEKRSNYWNNNVQPLLKKLFENGGVGYCKGSKYIQKITAYESEYVKGGYTYCNSACYDQEELKADFTNEQIAKKILAVDKRHDQLLKRYSKFYSVFKRLIEKKYYIVKDNRSNPLDFVLNVVIGNQHYNARMVKMKYSDILEIYDTKQIVNLNF